MKSEDNSHKTDQNKFDSRKNIVINALQPEFRLGSLYDRRTDNLLPGLSLWKEKSFKKEGFINEKKIRSQDFFLDSENTFSSKFQKLGIEPGLMLSVMSGMVKLEGHAKYLSDTSSSRNVAKASLTYKETTVRRQLTSDALHNPDFNELLTDHGKNDEFTHVVVGIEYGRMCTMVFERDVKENEELEDIKKAMFGVIKQLAQPNTSISVDEEYKKKTDNFRCVVYNDLSSNVCVNNWDQASTFFKSLSFKPLVSVKTDIKEVVPVNIYLLPKKIFGSQQDIPSKRLPTNIANKLKEIIESLISAINESHDLHRETKKFPILNKKISRFLKTVKNYKTLFENDILQDTIKSYRSGSNKVNLLTDAIQKHDQSAFGILNEWLKKIERIVRKLLAIPFDLLSFSDEDSVQNTGEKTNIVLLLKICKKEDKFIDEMLNYYDNATMQKTLATTKNIFDKGNWIEDEPFPKKLQKMAYQIRNFAFENSSNEKMGFFVREEEYQDKPDCSIEVWQNFERLKITSFEPPTKVRDLHVENYSYKAIEIKWNAPGEGSSNISNYLIEVNLLKVKKPIETLELVKKENILPNSEEVISYKVTNLGAGNTYRISVRCLSLEDTAFSKSETLTQMTRTYYPVANLKAKLQKKRQVTLTWEYDKVSENLKSFLIKYKTSECTSWKDLSVDALMRTHTLLDLRFATSYKFRLWTCYDGEEDMLSSEELNLTTEPKGKVEIKEVRRYSFK